jgi:hypothetical protein
VLCPFAYVAMGALSGFAPAFSFIALPPLVVSAGFLLYGFLARPPSRPTTALRASGEVISWFLIGAFLVVVSGFTLVTRFERVGLASTLFLGAALVAFPAVLLRPTSLEERLRRLPTGVALLLLLAILAAAGAAMVLYLLRPPAFL